MQRLFRPSHLNLWFAGAPAFICAQLKTELPYVRSSERGAPQGVRERFGMRTFLLMVLYSFLWCCRILALTNPYPNKYMWTMWLEQSIILQPLVDFIAVSRCRQHFAQL